MSYTGPHPQLEHIVLSDTFNEWRTKTNKHVDVLNFIKVYDLVAGDGITFSQTGGDYSLEVAGVITKGITFSGDVTFNGDVTTINTSTVTVDDKRIDLGAGGTGDAAGGNDSVVDGGGIALLSTDGNKTWTFSNSISGQKAWTSSEHIGITNGRALVSNDNVIRFRDSSHDELHHEFTTDIQGKDVVNISYAVGLTSAGTTGGATAAILPGGSTLGVTFGNGIGTGGIRIREDGYTEIINGVNRVFVNQTAHGFTHGTVVRFNGSGYSAAKGDSELNAEAFGIVDRYSHAHADSFVLVTHGSVKGFNSGAFNNEGEALTPGEIYFLSTGTAGAVTTDRPNAKTLIVKPMFVALSNSEAYVLNYIGGIVPDADIIQNSVPEVWRFIATAGQTAFGLGTTAGNASSTKSQTYLVTIDGVQQVPENASPAGAGVGITFGTAGGTGPADFRITSAADGVTLEFVEGVGVNKEVLVMNQALTTPVEAIDETVVRPDGAIEHRLLKNILGDFVSVKDYGAVSTGLVDTSGAIQAAIDQTDTSATNNKRTLFFPAGTYKINTPLVISNNSVELVGEGSTGGSEIRFEGTTGPMIKGPETGKVSDIRIKNIRLQMNSTQATAGGICVDLSRMDNVTIDGVCVDGCTSGSTAPSDSLGIKVNGYSSHRIFGSTIERNVTGIRINSALNISENTNRTQNVLIEGNRIRGAEIDPDGPIGGPTGTIGIDVTGGTIGAVGISLLNNEIKDYDSAISIAGNNENVYVSQNTFYGGIIGVTSAAIVGLTADGLSKNLVLLGNSGAANTGGAFAANNTSHQNILLENGAVSAVNLPKASVSFKYDGGGASGTHIYGGTGAGRTGSSFNVQGVVRESTGTYTINFENNLQHDNYAVIGSVGATAAFIGIVDRDTYMTSSSCRIFVKHPGEPGQGGSDRLVDPDIVSVTII